MKTNPSSLLPAGRYHCRLEGRETRQQPKDDGGHSTAVDLLLVVAAGPYAGHRLTARYWNEAKVQRARALRRDDLLVTVVTQVRLESGALVNRVVDFRPASEPSVIEAVGGEPSPISAAETGDAAAATDPDVPHELLQRLCDAISGRAPKEIMCPQDCDSTPATPAFANEYSTGFHWHGAKNRQRSLCDHERMLQRHATCEPGLPQETAGFISLYQYPKDMVGYASEHAGSLAGYRGRSWARWLAIDLDGDETDGGLLQTIEDTRRIVAVLIALGVPAAAVVVFFSGNRGMHILWPSRVFAAGPKEAFENAVGLVARAIAKRVRVSIDPHLYAALATLRAPNTCHEATGLYKIRITHDELATLTPETLKKQATRPRPFQMPSWVTKPVPLLHDLWIWACQAEASTRRRKNAIAASELRIYADTLDVMVHGAFEGSRGTRFFKAAMNLLDYDCPEQLLYALLEPAARLSGYPPDEFKAQINGALKAHAFNQVS